MVTICSLLVAMVTLSMPIVSVCAKTSLSWHSLVWNDILPNIIIYNLELLLTLFDFNMTLIDKPSIAVTIMSKSVHFIICLEFNYLLCQLP